MDYFSKEFLALRINYLKTEINNLPSGYYVNHKGVNYVRTTKYVDGRRVDNEYKLDTADGKKLANKIEYRRKCVNRLKVLMTQWKTMYKGPVPITKNKPLAHKLNEYMTIGFYNSAQPCTNDYPNEYNYVFNGISMRSRLELLAAQILTELEMDFKYEVTIELNGRNYSIDMLVAIPEKGRCIAFEFAGKYEDSEYRFNNMKKQRKYLDAGIIQNLDCFVIWGGDKWIPSIEDLRKFIITAIEIS